MTARVIVAGSVNQDYVIGIDQLPEPGETRLADGVRKLPGGKGANQAVAAARLGAEVSFLGAVGSDDDGQQMLMALRAEGIDTAGIEAVSEPTGLAIVQVLPGGENAIIVVPGANATVTAERVAAGVGAFSGPDAILVVQGEIPGEATAAAVRAAAQAGIRSVINLAPYLDLPADVLALADPLVVNEVEAAELIGATIDDPAAAERAAIDLTGRVRSVVITLGKAGACWASPAGSGRIAAHAVDEVVDTTGAGDAFVGGLVRQLAETDDLATAVEVAAEVGALAVGTLGAQPSYPRADAVASLQPR